MVRGSTDMTKTKKKNPLIKRIPRELVGDWCKYLLVSAFLILTIGFVSGIYVANGSMMKAADESADKYKLEDGHFILEEKADTALLEALSVETYEDFYKNEEEDNDGTADGTVRVYKKTDAINLACLMDGTFPQTAAEIAIDRMHADNVGIDVGHTITVGGETFTVTGLIAYVNYSTLHEKTTDMIFDALKFNVAMVTAEGFDRLGTPVHYAYAWQYEKESKDVIEEKKSSDDLLKDLSAQAMATGNALTGYTPGYADPAVNFATDDMGSDKAMGGVLLDILVVIIAFIFAITIGNTIVKESQTIGTLRALGYSRRELIRHYICLPMIVTLLAAGIGNILGYTVFKDVVVSMYYNSYSLPTYETIWNPDAFIKTTLVPVALMFIVNLLVICKMMRHTPLEFLRRDLKKKKRKKAIRLPHWGFFHRFRLRIIFQNIPDYLILSLGILFITVMLAMAVGLPDTLDFYKENTGDMMFAKYQYVLKSYKDGQGNVFHIQESGAEPFAVRSLMRKSDALDEEISVYGISEDSRYVKIPGLDDLHKDEVYISSSFHEKYDLDVGDTFTLDEKYEDRDHTFKVTGIYDKTLSLSVFMPIQEFCSAFDLDADAFSGYMSNKELTTLEEENISDVITKEDITKMCDQLDHSMGSYMQYFQILCVLLSAVLIYLLTKIIIEKNEKNISMAKILGYRDQEIARLYLLSTTIVVILADMVSVVLGARIMELAWEAIMAAFSGWFTFKISLAGYIKMFLFVLIGYLIVLFFDMRRIQKIPLEEALKNME